MQILVTGGAGYIGSHTVLALMARGHTPVIVDNLRNSKAAVLGRLAALAGRAPAFVQADVTDSAQLEAVMRQHGVEVVIHFAAHKAVGESVEQPLEYYANNVGGSMALLAAMQRAMVSRIVFSSSATVYAADQPMPLAEEARLGPINPYGHSKLMVEQILADCSVAQPAGSFTALRYFNPVGAHPSGTMGEDPTGIPNNLMPYIGQVAVGRLPHLRVFGGDYPTPDGTGVRDYIHVCDLADAHVAAVEYAYGRPGHHVFNLGTGKGHSVLEVLRAFSQACGRTLPYEMHPRRAGDVAQVWADPAHAQRCLGWQATRGLDAMCADAWRWQQANPAGYPAD